MKRATATDVLLYIQIILDVVMRQGDEEEEEEEGEHSNELTALLSLERCSNTTIDRQRLSLSLSAGY